MTHRLLGKKILFCTAHPDDESYMVSGTMVKNHRAGGKNFVVCATLGEKGSGHLPKPVTEARLKRIRKQELLKVSKFLKVSKLKILGLPDGAVKRYHKNLITSITKQAKLLKPDIIISYGPDGISGHLDHIAVGKAAKAAAKRLKLPFFVYSIPKNLMLKGQRYLLARRNKGVYRQPLLPKVPTVKIAIDPAVKLKALALHPSQIDGEPFSDFPEKFRLNWVSWEYFA